MISRTIRYFGAILLLRVPGMGYRDAVNTATQLWKDIR
jgi:hypothetical protein